jgi:RNA polymerase sigma-70 factor, ECF subfamily
MNIKSDFTPQDTLAQPVDCSGRASVGPPWSNLVNRIQAGDPSGLEDLYGVFTTGIRFYIWRQLGAQDLDDRVHEAFLAITRSIKRGDLREPERLMGYVRTVVRRLVASQIETVVSARRTELDTKPSLPLRDDHPDPERKIIEREHLEIARRVLDELPWRDREVLVRFYLHEDTAEQICEALALTATQFRLIKSRAKQRFGEMGRARLGRGRPSAPFSESRPSRGARSTGFRLGSASRVYRPEEPKPLAPRSEDANPLSDHSMVS